MIAAKYYMRTKSQHQPEVTKKASEHQIRTNAYNTGHRSNYRNMGEENPIPDPNLNLDLCCLPQTVHLNQGRHLDTIGHNYGMHI